MKVRHLKRGTYYTVKHIYTREFKTPANDGDTIYTCNKFAVLQTSKPLVGHVEVVLYKDDKSKTHWLRPYDEFFEFGRFKVISP